jgi:hypothetical protein
VLCPGISGGCGALVRHTRFTWTLLLDLVSHKFSVQPGGIEFTLPDEGELKT